VLDDGSTVITSVYGYPAGSNRLADVTQASVTVRGFTYDAAGNLTQDDRGGTLYNYYYHDRGRLKNFRIGNQVRANYRYDFLERLNYRETLNMTPAGTAHYVQDLDGRPIVEAAGGAMLREYVWLDDMPLAVFADLDTASPQLYYVHPDHLNRPLRMTDEAKAVVWDAVYKPFGEVHAIGGSASLNLRFPGQYFLREHGLAYNWHRYYDPTIGRYTRPDPLAENQLTAGQRGAMSPPSADRMMPPFQDGPSVYAYAKSAPTQHVDPDGRTPAVIVVPIALCVRSPALCAATAAAAANACIATYRALTSSGEGDREDDCASLIQKINSLVSELKRRYAEIIRDDLGLPPTGPGSIAGHQQQFRNKQTRLRTLLNEANRKGCKGYNADAWHWATQPAPSPG
jgi:RHS repeat-associated protein